MRPEPVLLLFIPRSIRSLPMNFRPPLLAALRLTEPQADLRIRYGGPEVHSCHYRLLGDWVRPVAAHAALVSAFSCAPSPEDHPW